MMLASGTLLLLAVLTGGVSLDAMVDISPSLQTAATVSVDLSAAETVVRVFKGCTIGEDYVTCLRQFGLGDRKEARFRGNLFAPNGTEIPMMYLPEDRASTVRVGGLVNGVYALVTSYLPAGIELRSPADFQMPTLEVVCFIPFADDGERDRFLAAVKERADVLGLVDRAAAGEDCSKYPEFAYRLSYGDRQLVGLFPGYSEGLLDNGRTKGLALIMRRG